MGKERLEALQRRWKAESFIYCLLLALAGSVLLTAALHAGAGWPVWTGVPIGAALLGVALLLFPYWRMTLTDIARYLDRMLPELEESCGLLLQDRSELSSLQKLQAARTAERVSRVRIPHPLRKRLLTAAGILLVSVLLGAGITLLPGHSQGKALAAVNPSAGVREPAAPGIRSVTIRVTPPAYTGRPVRQQSDFSLRVEEGAVLNWELTTTAPVDTLQFIFNDTARISLRAADAGHTSWRLTMPAMRSGFYQVRTGRKLSELYTFEVQRDEPPQVVILKPKPYTVVDYGEPTRIPLTVTIKDDYGIADATVLATISSGKGEAVKFKEQELRWDQAFTGDRTAYQLSRVLDLTALGLQPGDELYFFVRAKDSRGQEGRTEVYIISLTDTAQLMSLEGLGMSTDVKPEYFRSERQIIIETEQLLKDRDTLGLAEFHDRSNNLGIDQKLLRLRYGQFLGEEAEEGQPGGGPGDTTDFGAFGDATKILDVFTDKHDNAEDATFFEPGVKEQLKATLSEMWKAELKLRTFEPREALPFAYKALRLLKDLQQQSRVYVAKTGVRVTPLNPAKRLTGELKDIQAPVQRAVSAGELPEDEVLRVVLGLLDRYRAGWMEMADGDRALLRQAMRRMGREAAARPGEFLKAYQLLRRIVDGDRVDGIEMAQWAIRKLLPPAEASPGAERGIADDGLSRLYFLHLNEPGGKP